MSPEEQDIRHAHAAWISAVNSGDVDLLLRLMTDDAVFLNSGQQPCGPNGFHANFTTAKDQFAFTCASEIEEVSVVGDIAYVRSRDDLRITPRAGGPEVKLAGHRLTIYRRRKGDHWLLARDAHTLSDRMSVEEQKQVVYRFFEEVWNQRHRSVAAEIISPDCITHQLRSGTPDTSASRSPEILSAHVAEWVAAFPDIHFSVDQVVAERDLVAVHCTAAGTHTGPWLGIPPTGRQITIRMAATYRLAGGMIAEDWVLVDFLGVLQQLGLVQPTSELLQRSHQAEAGQS